MSIYPGSDLSKNLSDPICPVLDLLSFPELFRSGEGQVLFPARRSTKRSRVHNEIPRFTNYKVLLYLEAVF